MKFFKSIETYHVNKTNKNSLYIEIDLPCKVEKLINYHNKKYLRIIDINNKIIWLDIVSNGNYLRYTTYDKILILEKQYKKYLRIKKWKKLSQ